MFAGNINKVRRDMTWYWNCSDAALGISSNWFTVLNGDMGSRSSTNPENVIHHLKDIRRHRKLWQALSKLSRIEYRQLTALFDETLQDKYPFNVRDIFKDKTGLALCLFSDYDLLKEIGKKHPNKLSGLQHEILTQLKILTDLTYDNLLKKVASL